MADEKTEEIVKPEAPPKTEAELPVVAPVPAKKSDSEELGETLDQFFTGVHSAGMQSLKSMLAQLKQKADTVITKLDVGAGGDPPTKQG